MTTVIRTKAETTFDPPSTLEDGEARRLVLVEKASEIQTQLGDRNRMTINGRRVTSDEYWEWRGRAAVALRYVQAELRYLNLWLKQIRRERTADKARALDVNPSDPISLLLAAANVVQRLRAEGVDLDPDEIAVFDAIKDYLQHGPSLGQVAP